MNFNRKEWIINGALIAGILLILGLIVFRNSGMKEDDPASKIVSAKADATTPTLKTGSESTYAAQPAKTPAPGETPNANAAVSPAPSEKPIYSNLGSRNIFRVLVTASPTAPPPTPTPEATPSLEKAVDKWVLQYGIRGTWVFKDAANNQVEIKEGGAPYMATDGDKECPITVEGIDKWSCNLVCGTQKKKFSMIE